MTAPGPWAFAVLALAAFRLYRLIARDTITEPLRAAADGAAPKGWRRHVSILIRCAWCMGAYVSVAVWAAWAWQPRWTTFLAVPWALSAVVALAEKNLDP